MTEKSKFMNEREAAEYLGYTVYTLQSWRTRKGHVNGDCPFIKTASGGVRYTKEKLDEWMESKFQTNQAEEK